MGKVGQSCSNYKLGGKISSNKSPSLRMQVVRSQTIAHSTNGGTKKKDESHGGSNKCG